MPSAFLKRAKSILMNLGLHTNTSNYVRQSYCFRGPAQQSVHARRILWSHRTVRTSGFLKYEASRFGIAKIDQSFRSGIMYIPRTWSSAAPFSGKQKVGGTMSKSVLRRLAFVPACLMALWLVTSGTRAKDFDPLNDPVPKAVCGHSDHTESGLQGETTQKERSSGDSKRAYNCNLELVGEYRGDGAYSQDGPAYADNCAYYATDNMTSLQQHLGVTVVDVSDPKHP